MIRSLANPLAAVPTVAALAAGAIFVTVGLYWVRVFNTSPEPVAVQVAQPTPLDVSAGTRLFGPGPGRPVRDAIQLRGILAFDADHAAAVVSHNGEAVRIVRLGSTVGDSVKVVEIRARSIVIDSNGARQEIAMPPTQQPTAFIR
ncbi:type II secretion system protein N [Trinickia fusca]|uniref:General secretion pathway protein GspC n=1 Tax=Trinickia fusca TaxID=2419777 RepID=A0A494XWK4_9BURK|nr:type II secretion system protein N [Trinickia fusca]RKP52479.1 general secretion pathway protein GspC [Trinickia fusca]